jgi:myo-inositol 2-dehydrogenase/D-chiro-inositol 1-dehydrogenase
MLTHCIDTALWLNGGIDKVTAMTETFVKERKNAETGKMQKVEIDDASVFLARFKNGSLATFEATRYARGHKAQYTFEINGEYASIFWNLDDLHRLVWFDHREASNLRGWRSIHVSGGDHPYMKNWWVPGLQIGYEHSFTHQIYDFIKGIEDKKPAAPTFRDGLATDLVADAVLKSARNGGWEQVKASAR